MSAFHRFVILLLVVQTVIVLNGDTPVKSREQLTQELQDLSEKVERLEKLGEKQTEGLERLGEKLGEKQTEGLEQLGDKIAEGLKQLGILLGKEQTCAASSPQPPASEAVKNEDTPKPQESVKEGNCQGAVGYSPPETCVDVRRYDKRSGVHTLSVGDRNITVFCDQETANGGWTVIQRRVDGMVDFYRNWTDYKNGFGDPRHEFWLGLDNIYRLTSVQDYTLRVDLVDWNDTKAYYEYRNFSIGDPDDLYRLHVSPTEKCGDAGDGIIYMGGGFSQNDQPFSTPDRDNDGWIAQCAKDENDGGWWLGTFCRGNNLNGRYKEPGTEGDDGILWDTWRRRRSLKHAEMKIKPQI